MEIIWIWAGILLVVVTLVDTFFTVLNYNEPGLITNRVVVQEWRFIRFVTSRLNGHVRRFVYRQMTGVMLTSVILVWLAGLILGFSFIYMGALQSGALTHDQGAPPGYWGALYYSMGQFSTVGSTHFSPETTWVNMLSVIETLLSIVLLSMVITFLSNVYSSIQALRTLCASFPAPGSKVGSPVDTLAPYFPSQDTWSLEIHLVAVRGNFNTYFDSLAQDHSSLVFQSGKDQFSMPFGVYMTAGTLEVLRFGLPEQHVARSLAELERLHYSFTGCQEELYGLLRWDLPEAATPMEEAEFWREWKSASAGECGGDFSVVRFHRLHQVTADLAQISPDYGEEDLYRTYCRWLEAITQYDDFISRSSRYLGYRPATSGGRFPLIDPIDKYGWLITK